MMQQTHARVFMSLRLLSAINTITPGQSALFPLSFDCFLFSIAGQKEWEMDGTMERSSRPDDRYDIDIDNRRYDIVWSGRRFLRLTAHFAIIFLLQFGAIRRHSRSLSCNPTQQPPPRWLLSGSTGHVSCCYSLRWSSQ